MKTVLFALAVVAGWAGAMFGAGQWGLSAALALSPAAVLALLFLGTTVPFFRKAWRKDRAAALASPLLLFGRAAALSAGYLWGLIRPRRTLGGDATISGLNCAVQGGTTLGAWADTVEEIAVQSGGGSVVAPDGYVLKSFRLVQTPALGSKGFLRVTVTQP